MLDNGYVRDTETGEVAKVDNTGGNDFDIIQEGRINDDGSVTIDPNSETEVLEIDKEYTSGPGNMASHQQEENPTPGFREVHGKTPTIFVMGELLIQTAAFLGSGGSSSLILASFGKKGGRKQITRVFSSRKRMKDARPRQKPAKKGGKRVTRQTRNKNGEGNKMKTDHGTQTPHFHDRNHGDKTKPNIHYRRTKKYKANS